MRKNGKKALSLLLALVLVLGMLLGAAFAADSDFVIENGVLTDYHGPSGAVTIPNGVTSIGDHVFSGRTDLTSVIIPDGVTKIGFGAFYGCAGLTDVQVGAGNQKFTSIGGVLFSKDKKTIVVYPGGKKGAYTIPGGVTSIEWTAFGGCTGLTSVTIPSSVISIGQYALEGCTGLTSVTIPSSVTYIGDGAFSICTGLADIQVSAGNPEFTSIDGVLFSKDQKTIKAYPGGKKGAYTIPDNVTSIAGNAFESCEGLTGVTIPSSVTSIGDLAFQHCTGLTSVVIPNSVTSIEWSVFNLCAGLTSVTIPNSVTSIGWGAFGGCTGLTDVYYKGTEAQWQQISIDSYGNSRLTSATIHYNSTGPDGTEPSSPSSSKTSIKIDKYFYAPFCSETMLFFALETSAGHATEQLNSITWTSSNEKVFPSNPNPVGDVILSTEWSAQITGGLDAEDTTGNMAISATPKEAGTTTIKIKTADGATAECTLTVTGGGNSVSMDSEPYTIRGGNSGTVFADIKNSDQLDDISWTWESSNNQVISLIGTTNQGKVFTGSGTPSVDVSASIKFMALSPGTATISCTLDSGATASRQIVVISKNDNQRPIDSNAYNRPSYEQTVSEKNLKELEKLGQQWETKYKKLVKQVDKVLKEGDKDPDVLMAAVQPDEELARQLMKADKKKYLLFTADFPEECKLEAYLVLCEIVNRRIEEADISFDNVEFSSQTGCAAIANEIARNVWNYKKDNKRVTINNKQATFSYNVTGFSYAFTGSITLKYGAKSYFVQVCSTPNSINECITSYLQACNKLSDDSLKNVRKELKSDLLSLVEADILAEEIFQEKIRSGLGVYRSFLERHNLDALADITYAAYDFYHGYKEICDGLGSGNGYNFLSNNKKAAEIMMTLHDYDFGGKILEDKTVENAYNDLKKVSKKIYEALDSLRNGKDIAKSTTWGKKTQVNCPVNVEIYNSTGKQIGYVGEDGCWYDAVIEIEENDESKIIYSMAEDQISLRIVGNDSGKVNCVFEDYVDGEPTGRLNFYDINIFDGQVLSAKLPTQPMEECSETFSIQGNRKIFANEYIDVGQSAAVNISTEGKGEGIASITGEGMYVRGDAVVLRAVVKNGYAFAGWFDANNALVSNSSTYEFVARDNIALTAIAEEDTSEELNDEKNNDYTTFTDVPADSWYSDSVYWAVEQGITAGTSTNPPTFSPERTCTETEILTFLWRAAGQPDSAVQLPFTPKNSWAEDALRWAYEKGMISATFNESTPCTRASTAKFIWQAAGAPSASGSTFTDVPASADYAQAVAWAVAQGITQGTGNGAFSPNKTCTRAEIVTFLYRDWVAKS